MAANGDSQTVSEYIVHHLTNLTYGKLPGGYERYDGSVVAEGGQWTMAHGADEITAMGFMPWARSDSGSGCQEPDYVRHQAFDINFPVAVFTLTVSPGAKYSGT